MRVSTSKAPAADLRNVPSFAALLAYKLIKKLRFSAVRGSTVDATSKIESGTSFYCSSMDRHSFCGYDCDIFHADIGRYVSIANGVVMGGGRHPMEWVGMSPVFYEGRDSVKAKFSTHARAPVERVSVGHDVWIGRSAIVLPGVAVSNGAVIGAGAVVTHDVPPYAIAAGNPARVLRYRFGEPVIARLLASDWWSLDEAALRRLGPYMNDVEKFLEVAEQGGK
ncbi:MAG: CatB-related O-acetyltransferase [Vicinamibacterales bacterium]